MNTSNSFGFVLIGMVMAALPAVAPQAFPGTGFDGTSARALWLDVVGVAQMVIGAAFLVQIWLNRVADGLATVSFRLLDRSPIPSALSAASSTSA